jgi:hypothetical protein
MNAPQTGHSNQLSFVVVALVFAVGGILFPIPSFVELYHKPADTGCRPMGQVAAMILSGIGTPLVVIALSILGWYGRRMLRLYGVAAMILSLVPLPLYYFLFQWIVDCHRLILEP